MSDKEFEKFFEENHGDEGINPSCHQRLLLEAISSRADTINDMYSATTEFLSAIGTSDTKTIIPVDSVTIKNAERFMIYLTEQAKVTIEQSDYLISRILDGFEDNDDEGSSKE